MSRDTLVYPILPRLSFGDILTPSPSQFHVLLDTTLSKRRNLSENLLKKWNNCKIEKSNFNVKISGNAADVAPCPLRQQFLKKLQTSIKYILRKSLLLKICTFAKLFDVINSIKLIESHIQACAKRTNRVNLKLLSKCVFFKIHFLKQKTVHVQIPSIFTKTSE